jgi:hypothetical protein
MGTLREKLGNGGSREKVVEDGVRMIDAEVSDKGGLGGLAIKGAYAMVKGIAPGIMPKLLNGLLDEFLDALSPFYDEAQQKGVDFKQSVLQKQSDVANALLAVTDRRAEKSTAGSLKKGYEKLRPTAQKHVEQALPRLADFVKTIAG